MSRPAVPINTITDPSRQEWSTTQPDVHVGELIVNVLLLGNLDISIVHEANVADARVASIGDHIIESVPREPTIVAIIVVGSDPNLTL